MLANAPQARVRQVRHPTPIRVQARSYSERAACALRFKGTSSKFQCPGQIGNAPLQPEAPELKTI